MGWGVGGGGGGGPDPTVKSQSYRFSLNTQGSDPLEHLKATQTSIQCWAIIGPPAKRHFNAIFWRANDDGRF